MKHNTLHSFTLAAVVLGSLGMSAAATADVAASITAGSMHFWRGQSLSEPGPVISGDINYNHSSGFYTGIWSSSEGRAGSQQTDLTAGFIKNFGDFGFDVGIVESFYPGSGAKGDSLTDTDAREWYVGAIMGPVTTKLFTNPEAPDNKYLSIDGIFGVVGIHAGFTKAETSNDEYNDFNVSYIPNANLTWTVSVARGDNADIKEAPLFLVMYKWPIELK